MKTCEKCAVSVTGDILKCPLCQHTLSGEADIDEPCKFPFVPLLKHNHSFLYRMLQLGSAVVAIASLAVNYSLPQTGFWSLFVVAGIACLWVALIVAVRKRKNILKHLAYQMHVVCILSILWDLSMGERRSLSWSVDFVIPIAFVTVMAATTILARVLKLKTGDYIIYSCLLVLYGIIPVVFIATNLCTVMLPSLICAAASLTSFSFLLIFEGGSMAAELKRRLHL